MTSIITTLSFKREGFRQCSNEGGLCWGVEPPLARLKTRKKHYVECCERLSEITIMCGSPQTAVPARAVYTIPADPLVGGEGAHCPLPQYSTPALNLSRLASSALAPDPR